MCIIFFTWNAMIFFYVKNVYLPLVSRRTNARTPTLDTQLLNINDRGRLLNVANSGVARGLEACGGGLFAVIFTCLRG